ncbi:MAG: hypothetical protein ACLTSX_06285 [Collinsella sp.]
MMTVIPVRTSSVRTNSRAVVPESTSYGVAIAHQLKGGARDGLLGIDIHADALISDRNGQGLVQRDGPAVRAPEFAGCCERIAVAARP